MVGNDPFEVLTTSVPKAIAKPEGAAPPGRGRRRDRPLGKQDVDLLAAVPLFAELPRRHVRRLAERADVTSFREREHIVDEGQPGGTFYVIVQGEATVSRRGRTLTTLGPGDFFGEISLLDGGPRSADVIAQTPVAAIRIFKRSFDKMLAEEPGVAAKILAVTARRLRNTERAPRN